MLQYVMQPGQLKHYGLVCLLVIDLDDTACDPLSLNKKTCTAPFYSGKGAEHKRVKDLSRGKTAYQIRVERKNSMEQGQGIWNLLSNP